MASNLSTLQELRHYYVALSASFIVTWVISLELVAPLVCGKPLF